MVFYFAGLQNIEYSVYEEAKIDGANGWKTFWNITVPLLKPTIIMTLPESQTMPMLIANLAGGYTTDYGVLMVGVLFCSIPTMIVFFVLQKQFAEGITGAVK